jgi:soluble lytic murein transglycosylase
MRIRVSPRPRPGRAVNLIAYAFAALLALSAPSGAASLPPDELRQARLAYQAAEAGDYVRAQAAAGRDAALSKLVRWMELRRTGSRASFAEITQFAAAHPDWPGRNSLRLRAEEAMPADMPDAQVIAWFEKTPPVGAGRLRLAEAYARTGRAAKAAELVREAWIATETDAAQERAFAARYAEILRPQDHWERLDRLLWDGKTAAAQRMLPRVDAGRKALAEARIRLQSGAPAGDSTVRSVPANLQNDPGLLYDATKWRRIRDMNAEVRAVLLKPPANLVRPDPWWREVEYQARLALRDGDISLAYKLVTTHKPGEGKIQPDAEFLAGFIALRFLEDHKTALRHFHRLYDNVSAPISRARGSYWAGRAAEAAGDRAGARAWYVKAAGLTTTFYGQIAAGKLSDAAPRLPADPKPSAAETQSFRRSELARVLRILSDVGSNDLFVAFSVALVERAKSPAERALALAHVRELGRPDTAVAVARRLARDGHVLINDGYPLIPLPKTNGPEPALVYAIIRQESGFDQRAVSRAKAQGLMQLMPATARMVAKEIGLKYDMAGLTQNPTYNITLGSTYLNGLIGSFDGSYLAAIASYNAGPGRIRRWLRENGDVRRGEVDAIDWIEQIPIAETRNYVQRVLEALYIYRARLPKATPRIVQAQALNQWCLYGCGGVIEANLLKARVGKAKIEEACESSEGGCDGADDPSVITRDGPLMPSSEPLVDAAPIAAPASAAVPAEPLRILTQPPLTNDASRGNH